MMEGGQDEIPWALSDEQLSSIFRKLKKKIEESSTALFFDWSKSAVSEITPNVRRSLEKNFSACNGGFSVAKIAGLYTFWTAKLKPGFSCIEDKLILNEYLAIGVGFHLVNERIGITLKLKRDELLNICETLRYHTSSPHTLMHMYELWIEREKYRQNITAK